MALGRFDIRNCCSDVVDSIEWEVRDDITDDYRRNGGGGQWSCWDIANEYADDVYSAAHLRNSRCVGCYDPTYHVTFAGFVGQVSDTGCIAEDQAVLVVRIIGPKSQVGGVDDDGDLQDLIRSISSGDFAGKITWEQE
jgi:hypothetical protein